MKSIILAVTFAIATVSALPSIPHPYVAPGPGDFRSPCPALNTLANHGYLPHNGLYWKPDDVIKALSDVYNIDPSLGSSLAWGAIFLAGNPLTQSFSLGDFSGLQRLIEGAGLSHHNVIEHDASLTRLDAFDGDNHDFNAGLYKDFKEIAAKLNGGNFDADVISVHRFNRHQDSQANNPTFTFTINQWLLAYSEAAFTLLGLGGQPENGTALAATLDSFFIQEQIPNGYTKNPVPLTTSMLLTTSLDIYNMHPVSIQGIGNIPQDVHDLRCFLINNIDTILPGVGQELLDFVCKNTGNSLPTDC